MFSLVVDDVGAVGKVSVGHLGYGFRRSECSCRTHRSGSSRIPIYDIYSFVVDAVRTAGGCLVGSEAGLGRHNGITVDAPLWNSALFVHSLLEQQ